MDTSNPNEAKSLRSLRPGNTSSPTPLRIVTPFSASIDLNAEPPNTTTPPSPMISPLRMVTPFSASIDLNAEPPDTTTPPSPMVSPLRIITPFSASIDLNAEPPDTTTPPSPMVSPLQTITPSTTYDDDIPIKRGRGRPKGSKKSAKKPRSYDPNNKMIKSCPSFDSKITEAERETGNKELVESVLMRFDAVRRRLCQLEDVKTVLQTAQANCKNLGVMTNRKRRIGPVRGIQVGDIFYYRCEISLIGLHIQMVGGVDYLTIEDGASTQNYLATSVVTSGLFNDQTDDPHTLVYTGSGGLDTNGRQIADQNLKGGSNLALKESVANGNEVRVIRGLKDPSDEKRKIYMYDGLYSVSEWWKGKGEFGFEVFRFRLERKQGQPSGYAMWKEVQKWNTFGLDSYLLEDLSSGKEALPVSLVNEEDVKDEKRPQLFLYITHMSCSNQILDPSTVRDPQSIGCHCCEGRLCSTEDPKCACVLKNGGYLPYHNGILVCRKPMVYECGEFCPCPSDCKNRVVQSGLKIRVQVFKTKDCGWGLRSLEPIRAGTFICEFAGLVMAKEEVEEEDEEYMFDSSRDFNRFRWNYEPELVGEDCREQVSEVFNLPSPILISATRYGNVGRFMNHSCSPNVMWQPVECALNGEPYVRIGFFAMKHIPPLTELRYDYGMSCVAEEVGEDGTRVFFKGKKICLCGSLKCRGSFG